MEEPGVIRPRAGQDLNLLPPGVHPGVLPKAPPVRIAALMSGDSQRSDQRPIAKKAAITARQTK